MKELKNKECKHHFIYSHQEYEDTNSSMMPSFIDVVICKRCGKIKRLQELKEIK